MAGAAAALGKIKSETLALEGQKQEAIKGKSKLQEAIGAMKKQKSELSSNLGKLYSGLDRINSAIAELKNHPAGQDHPQIQEQIGKLKAQKEQIINQISYLKNGIKQINNRINEFQGKLGSLGESIEMMGSAIGARKAAMQKIAGQMAAQIGLNSNRELGKKKG